MVEKVWFEGKITWVRQSTHLLFSIHEVSPKEHRAKQMKAEGQVPEDTLSLVHVVRWFQHRLGTAASHHWTGDQLAWTPISLAERTRRIQNPHPSYILGEHRVLRVIQTLLGNNANNFLFSTTFP